MAEPSEREDEVYRPPKLKLANNLASPDRNKRERAMSLVCLWLTSQRQVKEEELFKIWKGLFYCLRQAGKVPSQQEDLVCRISNLIEKLDLDLSLMFFKTFLTTMVRELETIEDECGSSSIYILLSHNFSNVLSVLKINGWDLMVIQSFMDAILQRCLLARDGNVVDMINKQIADVFLNSLMELLPIPVDVLPALLDPFWMAMERGVNQSVSERIIARIFLPICESGLRKMEDRSIDSKDGYLGDIVVSLPSSLLSSKAEKVAAISESCSAIIKDLYGKAVDLENLMSAKKVEGNCNQSDGIDTASTLKDGVESPCQSPQQLATFKTFGPRTQRNQKISFSKQTEDLESTPLYPMANKDLAEERDSTGKIDEYIQGEEAREELEDGATPLIQDKLNSIDGNLREENSVILNLAEKFNSIGDDSSCSESFVSDSTCLMRFPSPTSSTPLAPSPVNTGCRKRKNWIFSPMDFGGAESPTGAKENSTLSPNNTKNNDEENNSNGHTDSDCDGPIMMMTSETMSTKKSKKVHFSLQHNIVWRPSTPLPPHDLRVPPGATPRGSALKKGIPPGPILVPDESILVSPKRRRKKNTAKKASSSLLKSPKSPRRSTKKGYLSPR